MFSLKQPLRLQCPFVVDVLLYPLSAPGNKRDGDFWSKGVNLKLQFEPIMKFKQISFEFNCSLKRYILTKFQDTNFYQLGFAMIFDKIISFGLLSFCKKITHTGDT